MRNQTDMVDSKDARTADTLLSTLATLSADGADRFDPVQFCYIQAMARRSQQQDGAVAKLVVAKTWEALLEYQSAFSSDYKVLGDSPCSAALVSTPSGLVPQTMPCALARCRPSTILVRR